MFYLQVYKLRKNNSKLQSIFYSFDTHQCSTVSIVQRCRSRKVFIIVIIITVFKRLELTMFVMQRRGQFKRIEVRSSICRIP